MRSISLDALQNGLAGITPALGSLMCECSVVCFTSQGHESGIRLNVHTQYDSSDYENFVVNWNTTLDEMGLKSHRDENRTTNFGSMAVATLLVLQLTDFTCFETSQTGTGIDFWLSDDSDDLNFFKARLEVSGIRKAVKGNTLNKRIKIKLEQTAKSDKTLLPAYISVIEFGKPESAFLQK